MKSISVQFVLTPEQTARETERMNAEREREAYRQVILELEASTPSFCQAIAHAAKVDVERLRNAIKAARAAQVPEELVALPTAVESIVSLVRPTPPSARVAAS